MSNATKIKADRQNRNCDAWHHLLDVIDKIACTNQELFDPRREIGDEHWEQIFILPETISILRKVKKLNLYGSNLLRIPPEIGQMESLEEFIPYTSYGLRWFPYEIIHCKRLVDSTVSTRALFGNSKNKKTFPDLSGNPVDYFGGIKFCSVCNKNILDKNYKQYWVSKLVGTDVLPLLANVCSNSCLNSLSGPHKGGHYIPN